MRTRVNKNKELHQAIASDTESVVESSDLSHFANRLNEIDDQFSRMNVENNDNHVLEHARQIEDTLDESLDIQDTHFDTFENAYLKDFLEEVKDYNVKKGYRDIDNTSTNIIKDLQLESQEKSRVISEPDGFVKPIDSENLETVLSEIDEDVTQIYKAVDHNARVEHVSSKNLDETIAMTIQAMSDETEEFEPVEEVEPIFYTSDDSEPSTFTRELLEQTQTLQHKIVDQERSIEEMGNTMVRTNRLLNTVLSLLMLAIFVVLMFIVSNIMKG